MPESLDEHLEVKRQGQDIPSQEASTRPSILGYLAGRTEHAVAPYQCSNVNGNGVDGKSMTMMGILDPIEHVGKPVSVAGHNGTRKVRESTSPSGGKPTPLETAKWKAVQKAKRQVLSIRGIARELDIHRDTAKKYMNAKSLPITARQPRTKDS